jgi:hypothetical protein
VRKCERMRMRNARLLLSAHPMVFSGGARMDVRSKLASRSSSSSPTTALPRAQGRHERPPRGWVRVVAAGRAHVVPPHQVQSKSHLLHAALRRVRARGGATLGADRGGVDALVALLQHHVRGLVVAAQDADDIAPVVGDDAHRHCRASASLRRETTPARTAHEVRQPPLLRWRTRRGSRQRQSSRLGGWLGAHPALLVQRAGA